MSFSTMPAIFENVELSEELTTALAAGRWWAIMEVSDPIPDDYQFDFSISEEWGETEEAGATSRPSSLVFSDASEKAHFQHSGFSDAKLKTTPEWRRKRTQGEPFSSRSPVPDRSARSSEGAPVPAWFPKEAPVPRGSQQRGKLRIPLHLTKHLIKASLETPMPIQSPQREPVSASKVFTHSSHGASMQDKIGARPKVKIPEPEIAPLSCSQADLVVKKISERRDAEIPELRMQNTHNAPEPESSAKLRIPKQREKLRDWWEHQQRQKNIQKGVSDSAGVDRSASQNKQRMAIQVNDRQSDPGGADQMDYLCCLFAKCFVI
ncbi:uncharacterized protein LOC120468635 [Pimephales promelas]|uniref:uncharacterized protein LOC120468635 n=1 Tax=Pimephales promelas TaxID=90988 RepID=UPI0019557AB3|nr:uncharacterized protein LOC120468635 [Pimephales promelas]